MGLVYLKFTYMDGWLLWSMLVNIPPGKLTAGAPENHHRFLIQGKFHLNQTFTNLCSMDGLVWCFSFSSPSLFRFHVSFQRCRNSLRIRMKIWFFQMVYTDIHQILFFPKTLVRFRSLGARVLRSRSQNQGCSIGNRPLVFRASRFCEPRFELVVGPLVTVGEQFFFLMSYKKSELHHRQMHWTSFRTTEKEVMMQEFFKNDVYSSFS